MVDRILVKFRLISLALALPLSISYIYIYMSLPMHSIYHFNFVGQRFFGLVSESLLTSKLYNIGPIHSTLILVVFSHNSVLRFFGWDQPQCLLLHTHTAIESLSAWTYIETLSADIE